MANLNPSYLVVYLVYKSRDSIRYVNRKGYHRYDWEEEGRTLWFMTIPPNLQIEIIEATDIVRYMPMLTDHIGIA